MKKRSKMAGQHNIKIPEEIYKAIESRIKDLHFKSVEDYIVQCLKQNLRLVDHDISEEDKEKIKDRLKSLGYLE
jgi:predicted small metal-binding protein